MAEPAPGRSWWTTLPGILTGVAALLTAVTGLLAVLLPLLHGRAEQRAAIVAPPAAAPAVVTPAVVPPPAARRAEPPAPSVPRPPPPARLAAPGPPAEAAPALPASGPVAIADAHFEVLKVESNARRGDLREFRVTFRVTAGASRLELIRSNVRILSPGAVHRPVEGLSHTGVPPGTSRQFWVRFEIREPIPSPILSLTDDWVAPRGEVRMPIGHLVAAGPDAQADGPRPLALDQRQDIAGAAFQVLDVQNDALGGDVRDIRVTFRVTAGATPLDLVRNNVRILTPGQIHLPVEGFSHTAVPAGASRQFWARFEVPAQLLDPVLSLTDDWIAPRGEIHGAL
ncbi:hypothetical protein [Falsiroseomonas sp. E2-1-a20]|uniref:hypothetical protein n=1 Tax=Falsiroseomonas sp. E2-1-a20 TaxID=3239300 RepID=UPI003F3A9492